MTIIEPSSGIVQASVELTPRWYRLKHHPVQSALWRSKKRFRVVPSGRRSGKTELAKRNIVKKAGEWHKTDDGLFVCAAPTREQAKRLYWKDLKKLVPQSWLAVSRPGRKAVSETELTIRLKTGTEIVVVGLDKPARIEGVPIDGMVLDEYANMKKEVWDEHIRPALSTPGREGWCWLIGVPEGGGHYKDMWKLAISGEDDEWAGFHWRSEDILDPKEIKSAKRRMDPLTYEQEYGGRFVEFAGLAYYPWRTEFHAVERLSYDPEFPLEFAFDFNKKPGIAAVCQEQPYEGARAGIADVISAYIGEVYIPSNSRTKFVARRLIRDWGRRGLRHRHRGQVYVYGDYTGGIERTFSERGSDWDIIEQEFARETDWDVELRLKPNPPERERVNTLNSRLMTTPEDEKIPGIVSLLVDPVNCPHIVEDFENVVTLEGGSGELDKKKTPMHTHFTDGMGYREWYLYPILGGEYTESEEI